MTLTLKQIEAAGNHLIAFHDSENKIKEYLYQHKDTILKALQQAKDNVWMPIETAPKDGTSILVSSTEFRYVGQGFFDTKDGKYWHPWATPTHWRPLPTPPTKDKDDE